ncbi:MAG: hypothetical protein Q4G36_04980 [Paracoccus sp. (in: a-proteobacteria)]|nr:hypothetical protein [Paracoccus sp. (in: a-proteobacteria)]
MPFLLTILGLIGAALVWYIRARLVGMAARDLGHAASDVMNAARRLGFRRRANMHPVESVDEPELAIATIATAFLELDGLPSREDQMRLARALASHTGTAPDKAEEMLVMGRWLVSECKGPQPAITRVTKRLMRLEPTAFQPLLAVLGEISGPGGLSAPQREALDEIARIARLR